MFWPLPSGRVIHTVFRDGEGHPKYLEILDTRRNARRIVFGPWWDGRDRSQSEGAAVSEADVPYVVEFFLEDEQSYWRYAHETSRKVLLFPGAFPWCRPQVGDQLRCPQDNRTWTVKHVPVGVQGLPWNGVVLLDQDVPANTHLRWAGAARERALVDFHDDEGHPEAPLPGEVSTGDVGTAYRSIVRPTVTHLLIRQMPATIGRKPFDRDKELAPRLRESFFDPDRPQVTLEIYGHRMENEFRFRCMHPNTAVASELALWFKRAMRNNQPSMEANGIGRILYLGLEHPAVRLLGKIAAKDVSFYFKTEELILKEVATLRNVNVNVGVLIRPNQEMDHLNAAFRQEGYEGLNPYTGLYDESGNFAFTLDIADYGTTGFQN